MALVGHTLNGGLTSLVAAIVGTGIGALYVELGTSATAATTSDTGNGTPDTTSGRIAGTITQQTTTQTGDTIQVVATYANITVNETVTEIAVYTAATGGKCIFHETGYSIAVGPSNGTTSLTVTVSIPLTAS